MRKFMIILHNIGRFFLLFEKSLTQGYHDDVLNELKENRIELKKLREEHLKESQKDQKNKELLNDNRKS